MPDPLADQLPAAVPLDREIPIARFAGIHQFSQGGRQAPNSPSRSSMPPRGSRQPPDRDPRAAWSAIAVAAARHAVSLDASGNRKLDKQEPRERLQPAVVAIMAVGLHARTKPENGTDRPFRA